MQCKSLWIKASAKCINVNVNVCIFRCKHIWKCNLWTDRWRCPVFCLFYPRWASEGNLHRCTSFLGRWTSALCLPCHLSSPPFFLLSFPQACLLFSSPPPPFFLLLSSSSFLFSLCLLFLFFSSSSFLSCPRLLFVSSPPPISSSLLFSGRVLEQTQNTLSHFLLVTSCHVVTSCHIYIWFQL